MKSNSTRPASAQCERRTAASHTGMRPSLAGSRGRESVMVALLLDLALYRLQALRVVVDLDLLAFLVLAVDLVAVARDLEFVDHVALRFDLRLGVGFLHPFGGGIGLAVGLGG